MIRKIFLLAVISALVISSVSAGDAFSAWSAYGDGWTATNDTFRLVMWNSTGNHTWVSNGNVSASDTLYYLIVAGGGAGGCERGGGGGAGGLITGSITSLTGNYIMRVGTGGSPVSCGTGGTGGVSYMVNDTFRTLISSGGGGGAYQNSAGVAGGSGGGGAAHLYSGGSGVSGQGYAGGPGAANAGAAGAGGGGGAGEAGKTGTTSIGGNGGNGTQSNITGTLTYYAGGGAGGWYSSAGTSYGGLGGGGNGRQNLAGTDGTNGLGGGGGGGATGGALGGSGGSGVVIILFSMYSNPIASFSQNKTAGAYPLPVQFTDTSLGGPTTWGWNFTDVAGNNTPIQFATTQNPAWTFGDVGNYTITLNATNTVGTNTTTLYQFWVNVSTPTAPVASFTSSDNPGSVGVAVNFNDTSTYDSPLGAPGYWNWSFDGGTSWENGTVRNKTKTFTLHGTYNITLVCNNTYGVSGPAYLDELIVNKTGFYPQDVWLQGQYTHQFVLTDKDTGLPIQGANVEDASGQQNLSIVNGSAWITEPFGTYSLIFTATGYDGRQIAYTFDGEASHSVQLTKSSEVTKNQNIWYSPHQVRLEVWNSYGNKMQGIIVNATANESSMPDNWLTDLYGIEPGVADDMVNHTLIMQATTGGDGAVVYTMHGAILYDIRMTNPQTGAMFFQTLMPKDDQYILRMQTSSVIPNQTANVYNRLANTSLTFSEPNNSYITMGLQYQDTLGTTSSLKFYVYFTDNRTVAYTSNLGNPGTSVALANYTTRNIRGTRYTWNYTAVRS